MSLNYKESSQISMTKRELDTDQVTKRKWNIFEYLKNTKQNKTAHVVIYLVWRNAPCPRREAGEDDLSMPLQFCHFMIFVRKKARLSEQFFTASLWSDIMKLV